jgi:hypothetical protein
MRLALWAAVSAMALGFPAAHAATEGSLFDTFARDCAAHARDPAAALNAATEQGWKAVPQQQLQDNISALPLSGLKPDWYRASVTAQPGRGLILFAGHGVMSMGTDTPPMPVAFCMLEQKPADPASLQQAGAWTSAPAAFSQGGVLGYVFTETAAVRRPSTEAQAYQAFQSGDGRLIVTMNITAQDASGIALIAPANDVK